MRRVLSEVWGRFGLLLLAAGMVSAMLAGAARGADGWPLMPVDDAYIHFQYAKQAATGQPFVYVAGDPATSGATSLVYPWLLAGGWLLGWRELALGVWAVLIGVLSLAACGVLARRMTRTLGGTRLLSEAVGIAMVSWGVLVWHAASGMETLLTCALTLAVFDGMARRAPRTVMLAAAALAVTRPEGAVLTGLAVIWLVGAGWREMGWRAVLRAWPVLLMGLQPALNLLLTGSAASTGGQAKSLLSMVPQDWGGIVERVAGNMARMVWETLIGQAEGGVWYLPPLWGVLMLVGLVRLLRQRVAWAWVWLVWVGGMLVAISTLDTAFWHFKRYQMPVLVTGLPLVAAAVMLLPRRWWRGLGALMVLALVAVGLPFGAYHRQNTESVAAQPYAMALWLRENAPNARVAVHDVGMMAYIGGVRTIDMVGLTTAGNADPWRHGVGAVGEALLAQRPDYYAAYDTARGLNYWVAAFRSAPVAEFTHAFDPRTNVALGGERQVILRLDELPDAPDVPQNGLLAPVLAARYRLADALDVADLTDEANHAYRWENAGRLAGFPTEFYCLPTLGCVGDCPEPMDGGRRVGRGETFTLTGEAGRAHVLVTRVHPVHGATLTVRVNDRLMATRLVPAQPGAWLELWSDIPADVVGDGVLRVEITATLAAGEAYMPYQHWLYAEHTPAAPQQGEAEPVARFLAAGAVLDGLSMAHDDRTLRVGLTWTPVTDAALVLPVDAVAFVHVYADPDQPPVVQADVRPGGGAYPPANWGTPVARFTDEFVLDLAALETGTYTVMVGLYAPVTFERYAPDRVQASMGVADGRLVVGQIIVK